MINILEQKSTTIKYSCDCGAKGMCSYKPIDKEGPMVVNLRCPVCEETERVTLIQYKNEKNRKEILDNIESMDLTWTPSFNEEVD
jgi:hypothetical protein